MRLSSQHLQSHIQTIQGSTWLIIILPMTMAINWNTISRFQLTLFLEDPRSWLSPKTRPIWDGCFWCFSRFNSNTRTVFPTMIAAACASLSLARHQWDHRRVGRVLMSYPLVNMGMGYHPNSHFNWNIIKFKFVRQCFHSRLADFYPLSWCQITYHHPCDFYTSF